MKVRRPEILYLFLFTGIFAIAMGFLEAIIVIYLRELYYPEGFEFPLNSFDKDLLLIELIRELATIIMLLSVGILAGKTHLQRFGFFLWSFAVWDIFYYVALKSFLNWPPSILTWDLLFLIPVAWVGPVLVPVICSFTMIILSVILCFPGPAGLSIRLNSGEWIALSTGALIIFLTFIRDYSMILIRGGFLSDIRNLSTNPDFQHIITTYVPTRFSWGLFITGELLIIMAIISVSIRKWRTE